MAHLSAYDSFKSKKSIKNKEKMKNKINNNLLKEFIVGDCKYNGIVIEVDFNYAYVLFNNNIVKAKINNKIKTTINKVLYPGDKVIVEVINREYIITNLIKRKNILSRVKKDSTREEQIGKNKIIATNIDIACIVVSANTPPLHPKFIDRYLMVLKSCEIDPIIVLNKCDLMSENDEVILDIYRNIKIPVVKVSATLNKGIDELKQYLEGKQAILVGNSGVGKSSLINAIMTSDDALTGAVGDKTKRGRHTTTKSKYYVWNKTSSIIDTPGIRSLDVSSFKPSEVFTYFPEFNEWRGKCKYSDCLHTLESVNDCAIKMAVRDGLITKDRYESYLRIVLSLLNQDNEEAIMEEIRSRNSTN